MAKKSNQQPVEKTTRTPDFIAYAVVDRTNGEGESKAKWREIGTAWLHQDGNGIQVRLDAYPVSGVVTLRAPLPPKGDA